MLPSSQSGVGRWTWKSIARSGIGLWYALAIQVFRRHLLRHAHAPGVDEQLAQLGFVEYGQPGADPLVPLVAGQRHHERLRPAGDQRGPLLPGEAEPQRLLVRRERGVDDPPAAALPVVPAPVLG